MQTPMYSQQTGLVLSIVLRNLKEESYLSKCLVIKNISLMSIQETNSNAHLFILLYLICKNKTFNTNIRQVKSVECLLALGALPNAKNQDN